MPIRMAAIKMSMNNKCWRGCGEKGMLLHLRPLPLHLCDSQGVSNTHWHKEAPGTQYPGYCQGQAPLITESYLRRVHSKPRANFHIKECKKTFIKIQLKKFKLIKINFIL